MTKKRYKRQKKIVNIQSHGKRAINRKKSWILKGTWPFTMMQHVDEILKKVKKAKQSIGDILDDIFDRIFRKAI